MVRIIGDRAIVSGHGPQATDGSVAGPLGRVPDEVTVEQAYESARLTGLSILADLQRALGDLDRIAAGAAMPALGEGAVCDFCAARGLCRKDHWGAP